jgi:predicted outer membrane repeat protein
MRAVYTFLTLLLLSQAPAALARTAYVCATPATSGAFLLTDDCELSGEVTLSGDLDILGVVKGDGSYPVVKAASSSRHFAVSGTHKLTLKYLKMIDGNVGSTGGSIFLTGGKVNISHCVFFNNRAAQSGGVIHSQGLDNTLDFDSVVFNANHATSNGGALWIHTGVLVEHSCTYTMNTAEGGGAIFLGLTGSTMSSFDSTFEGNIAVTGGGAIWVHGYSIFPLVSLTLTRATLKENKQTGAGTDATHGGGGLSLSSRVTANIRESTFIDNEATADSGTGKQGHHVFTSKDDSTPSLAIVNTQFTHIAGGHAFYGYDSASSSGSAATYTSPADCSANPCTDVAFPFCTDLGSNGVTCGPPACTSPDSNGYSVAETDLALASFDVSATCAVSGTATVTACASSGQPYVLSGCMPVYDCLNPATTGAFALTNDCQLSGQVTLSGDLDILGVVKGDGSYPVVKAASSSRHFTVSGTHKLTLKYLKMVDGNVGSTGGSINMDDGNANISHCVFFNNIAGTEGGAIYADGQKNLDFDSVVFNANRAINGGAVYIRQTTLVGHFCTFTMNTANTGGGAINGFGSITLFDSTFEGNTAVKKGGGINLFGYSFSDSYNSDLTLTRVTMKENKQTGAATAHTGMNPYGGGGLFLAYVVTVNIRESAFMENEATADAGSGKHGHQVTTYKFDSEGTPSIKIVNTNFTHIAGGHAFYGYDQKGAYPNYGDSTWGPDEYPSPADCSASPCTEAPFTAAGTCAVLGNEGVTCDYDATYLSTYNCGYKTKGTLYPLPPPVNPCSCSATKFDTSTACQQYKTSCPDGEFLGTDGTATSDHSCTPCEADEKSTGGAPCKKLLDCLTATEQGHRNIDIGYASGDYTVSLS